jgi:hypothetical protein
MALAAPKKEIGRKSYRQPDSSATKQSILFMTQDGLLRRIRLRPKAGFGGQECSSQ